MQRVKARATIMAMNEQDVRSLSQKLDTVLERLAAETGLAIKIGGVRFSPNNAVITIEAAERGLRGVVMGRDAEAFVDRAADFGLEPTDLGVDFKHFDKWYRIVGLKPRSKNPVLCAGIAPRTKHLTKFPVYIVRHYLEAHSARTKASPHASVRIELEGEADGRE